MTWFSLPATQATSPAVFHDAQGAAAWLAAQPQANVPAMLTAFETQIGALNRYRMAPRERFKTMEVLRKAVFAVSNDCQRRYENKALPLLPAEQTMLDAVRRLWRSCTIAYQHCLQSCLENDPALSAYAGRVAHRALFCLRMEQLNSYAAATGPESGFWKNLHATFTAAGQLGVAGEVVEDRLLAETSESTVNGQYVMALLLHLARPFSLTGGQFSAVVRWLARWREQAAVLSQPEQEAKSCCIALDLSQDRPFHEGGGMAQMPRWLSLDNVLRKIRRRVASLDAGESPESLKLGGALAADVCRALLETLGRHLQHPPRVLAELPEKSPTLAVGVGLVNIHRLLGGQTVDDVLNPLADSYLSKEQLAVFGHVVREAQMPAEEQLEHWQQVGVGRDQGDLVLLRAAVKGALRLSLRSLLAIRQPEGYRLAQITSLQQRDDGKLCATVSLFPGGIIPLLAEIREKASGKISRHPAFQLPVAQDGAKPMLLLPAGLVARASVLRFLDADGLLLPALRLADCLERGGEVDFWRVQAGT